MLMTDDFETPKEVAQRIKRTENWLAKSRCYGFGPPFLKISGLIRYRRSDVDAWLAGLEHASTADYRRKSYQPLAA
jgi:hypothetical protein